MRGNPDVLVFAIFGGVIAGIAAMFGLGVWLTRRRHRRIRVFFEAMGASVDQIDFEIGKPHPFTVRYVAAEGDMREAKVGLKPKLHIMEDRPYHHVIYDRGKPEGMLAEVKQTMDCGKLPGTRAMQMLILQLEADPTINEITLREGAADTPEGASFTAIVQAFEAANMFGDDPGLLELMVNQQAFDARWWIEGDVPNRVIYVSRVTHDQPL